MTEPGDLRIRLEHALALLEHAVKHRGSLDAVAQAVRFAHEVLGEARALNLTGGVDDEARDVLNLVLELSLRLGAIASPRGD